MKSGRTHLMDAVPVTLGQEFAGYAAQIRLGYQRVDEALPRVAQLPLGGTATGTGPEHASRVRRARARTDHAATPASSSSSPADPFEAQGNRDALVELSGTLKVLAVSLTKIANDIAWMGSGPRAGLAELYLPELQKGSSIMPGKVNPVIPEVVLQVSAQVIGNDTAITIGGMQGNFELNVRIPLIARNLLQSISLLAAASRLFAEKCIDGIEPNEAMTTKHAESTLASATALNPHIGYDKATESCRRRSRRGRPPARWPARWASRSRCSTRRLTCARWRGAIRPSRARRARSWADCPNACWPLAGCGGSAAPAPHPPNRRPPPRRRRPAS